MAGNTKASFRSREPAYRSRKKIRSSKKGVITTRYNIGRRRQKRQMPTYYDVVD